MHYTGTMNSQEADHCCWSREVMMTAQLRTVVATAAYCCRLAMYGRPLEAELHWACVFTACSVTTCSLTLVNKRQ